MHRPPDRQSLVRCSVQYLLTEPSDMLSVFHASIVLTSPSSAEIREVLELTTPVIEPSAAWNAATISVRESSAAGSVLVLTKSI